MPFTLSHAAAALPLRHLLRGAAVFPALVIGCFIPDVPYFLPEPLCNILRAIGNSAAKAYCHLTVKTD